MRLETVHAGPATGRGPFVNETDELETVRLVMTPLVFLNRKTRTPFVTMMSLAFVAAVMAGAVAETLPTIRSRSCDWLCKENVQV